MASKFIVFAALVAAARAVVVGYATSGPSYSAASDVSYSSFSLPVVSKVAAYSAPAAYNVAAAPVYSTQAYKVAAPVYSTQAYKVAAPVYSTQAYKVAAPVAYSAPIAYSAPVKQLVSAHQQEEYAPGPYQFAYAVSDPHTGDSKSHEEHREGDVVKGSYSLIEADGSRRIVEYTADSHNGFNAVVHNEPAKVAVKTVAAPLVTKVAAPVAYAAPAYAKLAAPAYGSYYH